MFFASAVPAELTKDCCPREKIFKAWKPNRLRREIGLVSAQGCCQLLHMLLRRRCQVLGGGTGERESMVRLVPILVADGHTVYGIVASCIPDDQCSPAPPVTTKPRLFAPCTCKAAFFEVQQARVLPCLSTLVTIAILAQGTNWVVAATQAFFENGQRQSAILHR